MTSRERLIKTLNHEVPDKVPIDLGATAVTGIHASSLSRLKKALDINSKPVKIHEPYQLLGEIDLELIEVLDLDVVGIFAKNNFFGFANENWKPWTMPDGTEVLVPGEFNITKDEQGNQYLHPKGDISAKPSGVLPKGGFYFDAIVRQEPYDPEKLNPKEWMDGMFSEYSEEDLKHFETTVDILHRNTTKGIILCFGQGGFGDIAFVPGTWLKNPKGIRDITEWYMAPLLYPDYIKGIFELQCEIALKNLQLLKESVGNKIQVIYLSGSDYGSQSGPMISPDTYRKFTKPLHKNLNDWIHANTTWKSFIHSCGSIIHFIDDFIEAGFDILNPVQTSATGMGPKHLKEEYGEKLVFWGGGIDTQQVLPFGKKEEVEEQVKERIKIFGKGGGFVFTTIHNIQHGIPVENLVAMFNTFEKYRTY